MGFRKSYLSLMDDDHPNALNTNKAKKTLSSAERLFCFVGGPDGTRTRDPLRDRQVF